MSILSELPARVGAVETHLIAVREDLTAMRGEFVRVWAEFAAVREELRTEIRAGDEETRHQMRVLHEEVIARIALLQEGMNGSGRRNTRSRRRGPPKRDL